MPEHSLLVVAGEASGDEMAAAVVRQLDVSAFGIGGDALRACGTSLVADIRDLSVMGLGAVVRRAGAIAHAARNLQQVLRQRRPSAALLVGFSEFNARLGRRLRARGIPVVWYAPPQVWAWRPGRGPALARSADELAVLLPFEESLWRQHGARVRFVGHPSTESGVDSVAERSWVTLLPGSREHEVRRHLGPMLHGALSLGHPVQVVLARSLTDRTARWATRLVIRHGAVLTRETLAEALSCSLAAVVASGTATATSVACGAPPVIVYKTDRLTWALARRLVRVPHIGLPNLVLDRRVFPELLQQAVNPTRISAALADVLGHQPHYRTQCEQARTALMGPGRPSGQVAAMLQERLDSSR